MPLSVRASPAAQRTIREAFTDLQRTISDRDSGDFANTTLQDVRKAAHMIEDQLAARQLLRNTRRLMPLFTGLQYYSQSIEVLCNGTPYLPWVWAPIKLVLKVASDYVGAFDKLITAYARIAEPLARFEILNSTYYEDKDFQQTLAVFYSDILKFHKEAYKFVRRGSWQVLFMTSWGRFQLRFDGILEDLKAHENLVDKTANAVGLSDAREMRKQLEFLRQESLEKVSKEEGERSASQYLAITSWLKMDESEQVKIFESIAAEGQKYPGTSNWILGQEKIAAWMRCSQESTFLVLHGHPGSGKSVLATQIADFLRSSDQSLIISHICTYSQPPSTEYDQILRSILLKLVRSNQDLVEYIFRNFILGKTPAATRAIESLILDVLGAVSNTASKTNYVHIVLDGLDECNEKKQPIIINLLERMISSTFASTSTVCKVLVTSRMPPNVAKKLRQKHVVSLSKEKAALEKAISIYAAKRLGDFRLRWFQLGINDAELKKLERQLAKKADGMFLWARLVLEYLTTNMFVKKSEIMGSVHTLPRELSEFYRQILTQLVSNFDERSVMRLRSILGWIAFAKRPLRKVELCAALSFSKGEGGVNIEELAPNYLFDMCTPLIEERSDSTFTFIHVSVKEFLYEEKGNIIPDEVSAGQEQGLVTAACLLSGLQVFQPSHSEDTRLLRVVRGFHGLHMYSSEYWVEYLLSSAASDSGLDTCTEFFSRSHELAMALNALNWEQSQGSELDQKFCDERLAYLQNHPDLWKAAGVIISERTLKDVESGQRSDVLIEVTNLFTLLFNYQHTVKRLLHLQSFPGVTIQELERFKQEFRYTAFTCRLWSCPLAGTGFETEALRDDHERAHKPRIPCEIPGCQYPPFSSTRTLKNHLFKHHGRGFPKIRIRKPRNTENARIPIYSQNAAAVSPKALDPNQDGRQGTDLTSSYMSQDMTAGMSSYDTMISNQNQPGPDSVGTPIGLSNDGRRKELGQQMPQLMQQGQFLSQQVDLPQQQWHLPQQQWQLKPELERTERNSNRGYSENKLAANLAQIQAEDTRELGEETQLSREGLMGRGNGANFMPSLSNLSPQERTRVVQMASHRYNAMPQAQRNHVRTQIESKMPHLTLNTLAQQGMDPVLFYIQTQMIQQLKNNANNPQMPMQAQKRQMNQNGQQTPGGPNESGQFAAENTMNQQRLSTERLFDFYKGDTDLRTPFSPRAHVESPALSQYYRFESLGSYPSQPPLYYPPLSSNKNTNQNKDESSLYSKSHIRYPD